VYIITNPSRTLYTGITNNLRRPIDEHKRKLVPGFTSKYNINRVVYFEVFEDVRNADRCEKKSNPGRAQSESRWSNPGNPKWDDFEPRVGSA